MKTNLEKIANAIEKITKSIVDDTSRASHIREVGALGALAIPSAYHMATGDKLNDNASAVLDVGGLTALAAPYIYKIKKMK